MTEAAEEVTAAVVPERVRRMCLHAFPDGKRIADPEMIHIILAREGYPLPDGEFMALVMELFNRMNPAPTE